MPKAVKEAVVAAVLAGLKLTAAGPETKDQLRDSARASGRPSSVTVPVRGIPTEVPERVADLSGPALTSGAVLVGPADDVWTKTIQSWVVVSGGLPRETLPPTVMFGRVTVAPVRGFSHFTVNWPLAPERLSVWVPPEWSWTR